MLSLLSLPEKQPLVSVIIPTFERYQSLQRAIKSVREQTWSNIEIIVVDDCSSDSEYRKLQYDKEVKYVRLEQNTRQIFGYPSAGYVRQVGVENSRGKYIAFLDDDDTWLPWKLQKQISALKKYNVQACCTEGLFGAGEFDVCGRYKRYNSEVYREELLRIFEASELVTQLSFLPKLWNASLLSVHNCVITSSVLLTRSVFDEAGGMRSIQIPLEDYDCWRRVSQFTEFAYVGTPCVYYDGGHAGGQRY